MKGTFFIALLMLDPTGSKDIHGKGPVVCKFDSSGKYYWGLSIGKNKIDNSAWDISEPSIAVSNGCLYVAGQFDGPTDFNPGPGTHMVSPPNKTGMYLLKLML